MHAAEMAVLHRRYGDGASFIGVYIAEAHATDEWPMGDHVALTQPRSLVERIANARTFKKATGFGVPLFADGIANGFMAAFSAHPERYFIVQRGMLVWKAQPSGLGGYDLSHLASALETMLRL